MVPDIVRAILDGGEMPTLAESELRRFVWSPHRGNFGRKHKDHFEYLTMGHAWLVDSFRPYHEHGDKNDLEICVFERYKRPKVIARKKLTGQHSVQAILGPGDIPEEVSILVYVNQLQQNARIRLTVGNVEAPAAGSDMNEHMMQFVFDLTSFSVPAGDTSELVIEVLNEGGNDQIKHGEIVVVAEKAL